MLNLLNVLIIILNSSNIENDQNREETFVKIYETGIYIQLPINILPVILRVFNSECSQFSFSRTQRLKSR